MRQDKHRENYLGNSVAAPKGRWAEGKDIHWYDKDRSDDGEEKRRKELLSVKQAEQEEMNRLLYVCSILRADMQRAPDAACGNNRGERGGGTC